MQNELKIHILFVGKSDCILLEFPDQSLGLIDCGFSNYGSLSVHYLKDHLLTLGYNNPLFRFVIMSHPDKDHVACVPAFLKDFRNTEKVYYSALHHGWGKRFSLYIEELIGKGNLECVSAGQSIEVPIPDLQIRILCPQQSVIETYMKKSAEKQKGFGNNVSVVTHMKYGSNEILFTSDAPDSSLKNAFPSGVISGYKVIQIPHHGSKRSLQGLKVIGTPDDKTCLFISCDSLSEHHPGKELLEEFLKQPNMMLRCTGFSQYCSKKKEELQWEPEITDSLGRAHFIATFEGHTSNIAFCNNVITISVPPGGKISVSPPSKHCDN